MPVQHSLSDTLEIIYHRDYHILIGRFLRPVSEAENRQCYLDLLAAAHARGDVRYWLLDIRRRDRSGPLTLDWLFQDFYPRLVRELGAPMRMVYFMAPGLREEFRLDGGVLGSHIYEADGPFRIYQSITEGDAVRWLLAEQEQAAPQP